MVPNGNTAVIEQQSTVIFLSRTFVFFLLFERGFFHHNFKNIFSMIIGIFSNLLFRKTPKMFLQFTGGKDRGQVWAGPLFVLRLSYVFTKKVTKKSPRPAMGIAFSGHKSHREVTSLPTIRNLIQTLWAGAKNVGRREMTFLACPPGQPTSSPRRQQAGW